jgi:cell division protein FtsI/penicillin-binding protein 2
VLDPEPDEAPEPVRVLNRGAADLLGGFMRSVVQRGSGRVLADAPIAIAGKTGTAEIEDEPSHSWFIGYAPYGQATRRVAFAVLIENGGYGTRAAAPLAGEIAAMAHRFGLAR